MARESKSARAERAAEVFGLLAEEYPDARCALTHTNAYQLGVATILSAQTTDVLVNSVTPILFERYPTPAHLADARPEDVEEIIRSRRRPTGGRRGDHPLHRILPKQDQEYHRFCARGL